MTRPSTSEALGGLLKALEQAAGSRCRFYQTEYGYNDCFDNNSGGPGMTGPCDTCIARAALTSWRERSPLREDAVLADDVGKVAFWYGEGDYGRSYCAAKILDVCDRSLFSETPPVKEENRG